MSLLQMLLHLVRPRELFLADDAGKHLPGSSLVIQESVPLEAVLVLKGPRHVILLARDAAVHAFLGDGSVAEQIQAADRHLLQLFRVVGIGGAAVEAGTIRRIRLRRRTRQIRISAQFR